MAPRAAAVCPGGDGMEEWLGCCLCTRLLLASSLEPSASVQCKMVLSAAPSPLSHPLLVGKLAKI